jgi:hypothetical protein
MYFAIPSRNDSSILHESLHLRDGAVGQEIWRCGYQPRSRSTEQTRLVAASPDSPFICGLLIELPIH